MSSLRFTIVILSGLAGCLCGDQMRTPRSPASGGRHCAGAQVDTDRIQSRGDEPEMWLTMAEPMTSSVIQLWVRSTGDTLPELGVGWVYETAKPRGAEATPIVVDGVMYVSSAWSVVYALDARTGEELWVYDPRCRGKMPRKGVAMWSIGASLCTTERCLSACLMAGWRRSMRRRARWCGAR